MMPRSIKDVLMFFVAVVILFAAPLALSHGITNYVLPYMGKWNDRIMYALALAGYVALVYLGLRRDMPKALRRQLIKSGVPVCIKCGYDLRGLPADCARCPECGREFDQEVSSLVRHQRPI